MAYTTIDDPTIYFNTVIWSGDSSSPENITVGFEPDWIWGKSRNTGYNHQLFDSVRGFGNDKELQSNITAVQGGGTADQYGYISGTTSTGFTATKGSDGGADGYGFWNESGRTYVAWNWKANGSGATNEDGSINTIKTSASTTSGFSISTYTGTGSAATVGHGLGVVPSVMIVKRTNSTGDWLMYHKSLGNGKNMRMNEAGTEDTSSAPWNATTPTSSVFSVGAFGETNGSSDTFVAYCFAPIKGYSAMGSYTGMEVLMEHLFIQDLNQLGFFLKKVVQLEITGLYLIIKE
tara:strand:- start:169 stop:1041 length:873 start_codon:yes stop_codon:yes gene_type:complete